jgi:phenylacetate-CoA ligase
MSIPDEWRARSPRMSEAGYRGLKALLQHVDAPRWNHTIGDNVGDAEAAALDVFREDCERSPLESGAQPSEAALARLETLRTQTFDLAQRWPEGLDPRRDWDAVPTCSREDLASRLVDFVPHQAPLADAVLYTTSGTTGHALNVLHHPGAVAKNHAFGERALLEHGLRAQFEPGRPGTINMCAQRETFVFATCFSVWNNSGFAKLNLPDHAWAGGAPSRERFLTEFAPELVTADPLTLATMLELDVPVRPKAIFSSALMLDPAHAAAGAAHFGCPVIDFYGATEVGPIAAKLPGAPGHVVLLPDLYVEALDHDGLPVPDGQEGELTFTGGRNPYMPLVRYRSSDRGALGTWTLADGRQARVILGLQGRESVRFRARDGSLVNSVDVGRALREVGPFVQHEVHQRGDHSVDVQLRPSPSLPVSADGMRRALEAVFGPGVEVRVELVETFGHEGKPRTFSSELS